MCKAEYFDFTPSWTNFLDKAGQKYDCPMGWSGKYCKMIEIKLSIYFQRLEFTASESLEQMKKIKKIGKTLETIANNAVVIWLRFTLPVSFICVFRLTNLLVYFRSKQAISKALLGHKIG